MGAELLPWVFTSGWASGINAYAVVLVMGLLGRFAGVDAIPGVLGRTDVLLAASVLFLLEMVADKIPYLDSAWDSVHTVVRPAVGATLGYLLGHESSSLDAAFGAAAGGFSALASHGVKAGLRAAVNTSPEPVSNVAVSSAEDLTVAGVVSLAALHPWWAASIAATLLVVGRDPGGVPAGPDPAVQAPVRRLGRPPRHRRAARGQAASGPPRPGHRTRPPEDPAQALDPEVAVDLERRRRAVHRDRSAGPALPRPAAAAHSSVAISTPTARTAAGSSATASSRATTAAGSGVPDSSAIRRDLREGWSPASGRG